MSRSYKKPYIRSFITKGSKRESGQAVRREKYVSDGGVYKKIYNNWNIWTWKHYVPKTNWEYSSATRK